MIVLANGPVLDPKLPPSLTAMRFASGDHVGSRDRELPDPSTRDRVPGHMTKIWTVSLRAATNASPRPSRVHAGSPSSSYPYGKTTFRPLPSTFAPSIV